MTKSLQLLAEELHRITRGAVVLCDPEAVELLLMVQASDSTVVQFVSRLKQPPMVSYQNSDGYRAWLDQRTETPTEAALGVLGLRPEELATDLRLLGAFVEAGANGCLYIEENEEVWETCVLLVDGRLGCLAELGQIRRRAQNGSIYPLFEPSELVIRHDRSLLLAGGQR